MIRTTRGYFECFNRQWFFEAHDVLEELWLAGGKSGPNYAFHKGLIQLAGRLSICRRTGFVLQVALSSTLAEANLRDYPNVHDRLDLVRSSIWSGTGGDGWSPRASSSIRFKKHPAPQIGIAGGMIPEGDLVPGADVAQSGLWALWHALQSTAARQASRSRGACPECRSRRGSAWRS